MAIFFFKRKKKKTRFFFFLQMMPNMEVNDGKFKNQSRIARVDPETGKYIQETLPENESRSALLQNLYCSQGKPGKVLKIHCKKRIGEDDFVTTIRKILKSQYNGKSVGECVFKKLRTCVKSFQSPSRKKKITFRNRKNILK